MKEAVNIRRNEMPLVTVEGPAIKDVDVKRTLVREMTEATAKAFGNGPA